MVITIDQISRLLEEAAEAGDMAQVVLCQQAIEAGPTNIAWEKCERVIVAARAAGEED